MSDSICYLNTDLDLVSATDLTGLAAAMKARGVSTLHCGLDEDGLWYATFEVHDRQDRPEAHIGTLLTAVESLAGEELAAWSHCVSRYFDIGYDCGSEPRAFSQGLSGQLLGRIAVAGASLRIMLYSPPRDGRI